MSVVLHLAAAILGLFGAAAEQPRRRRLFWGCAILCLLAGLAILGGFFTTKWLGRLAMPPALVAAGLYAMVVRHILRRGPRRETWFLGGLLLVHAVTANIWVGAALVRGLEAPFGTPRLDVPLDAALVLGGGTSARPGGTPQLSPSGDRVMTALRLMEAGQVELLVCSGSATATEGRAAKSLGAETFTILTEAGVEPKGIVALPGPRNTREEIAALAVLMRERGWHRVGVVTSAWHLRRTMRHVRREGIEVVPIPADYRGGTPPFNALELLPSAEGFYLTRLAAWELLGMLVGR